MTTPKGMRTSPPVAGDAITARLRAVRRPVPVVAPLIASKALKCSRQLGFGLFGVTPDIPLTNEEKARFEEGDFVDSTAAEALVQQFDARIQVPFSWLPRLPLKGKADAGYRREGRKYIVEVKSASERAWSRAVGLWESVPPAPKPEWLVQAGLAALSPTIGAEYVHIILVDNDRYDTAEWVIGIDDPLEGPDYPSMADPETGEIRPATIRRLVEAEVERLAGMLALCEAGTLPARLIPGYGLVEALPDRDAGHGDPWPCMYCAFHPTCSALGPLEIPDFAEMPA